ncbi:glycosyltransferase [Streptomyces sp. V4I2]|uniref:glycosyltransferase n=1 Tax=Streptomyces sp. V4I2 TaxID=3042280 RepID=UPI00278AB277|nr:glycosyltransferase [Streptomyces sp. V4I2]MDQ1048317.1 glycosyltransferase involved in cell wall biosynthesis [Streptomyces sp. V4I2]
MAMVVAGKSPTAFLSLGRKGDAENRIFHTNIWFTGSNARYESLLPRLHRIDNYLLKCADNRYVRGVQFRTLHMTSGVHNTYLFGRAARTYRYGFITNVQHIAHTRFPVVVDMDDPFFTTEEISLLGSQRVAAIVVTNESAANHYCELGIRAPIRVIGQGASTLGVDPGLARQLRQRRVPGELTVGYVAAWHQTAEEAGAGTAYDVDHLVDEVWPAVVRACPRARLWLVGGIGAGLRRKLDGRDDIEIVGRVPQHQVPTYLAAFDAAVYPRRIQHRRAAVKLSEYISAGVPVIGYRCVPTDLVTRTGAGIVVDTTEEFVRHLTHVLRSPVLRGRLADNARAAASLVDWNVLAQRYAELLDEFLPAGGRAGLVGVMS